MKYLCVCQGGSVRSVTLAHILKYGLKQDAIAMGWEPTSKETAKMLFEWADQIIVMQTEYKKYIPKKFLKKTQVCDVGPDIWGMSLHPDLIKKIHSKMKVEIKNGT